MKHSYHILMHSNAYRQASLYLQALQSGQTQAGARLAKALPNALHSTTALLDSLINTKSPQIFAESDIAGDGSDWSLTELAILGDIGVAVDATIYDNGLHRHPAVHAQPFDATLLFIPGALLRNDQGHPPADWAATVSPTRPPSISPQQFNALYEQRLVPLLAYANDSAGALEQQGFVTIPGLGCGLFAGPFQGLLGQLLRNALVNILEKHGHQWPHLHTIYYDPYGECTNETIAINGIAFRVQPLLQGNAHLPQLCQPEAYAQAGQNLSNCRLFSMVAWDHVSWPGNDYYIGSRATDDGVKAAASSSMATLTGIQGHYDANKYCYLPPAGYSNWKAVIEHHQLRLQVHGRLLVYE